MSQPHDSDDEYQVVVEATPPPQRRPRTPNPAVDDVIQSGEIQVPRSMIIRSQSQPAMPVYREDSEPTEISGPPAAPKPRMKVAWLLAAAVPAIAAIALSFVHGAKTTAPTAPVKTAEAESLAQLIGTLLDGDAHAVQVRAEAIASSSMLRAAIQTDASTMADMAKDNDIVFPHGAGETIEVFQGKDGARTSLLRLPATATAITPPAPGTARLDHKDGALIIVVDAPVTAQNNAVAGDIALSSPLDMSRIQNRKYEQLTGVTLTGFGAPIQLGGGPAVANGQPITAQVTTTVFKGQTLAVAAMVAAPPAATQEGDDSLFKGLRIACASLALLFVVMFGVSVIVRR